MSAKIGRNEPCPCGSGKKYKQCCEKKSADSAVASGGGRVLFLFLILVIGGVAATFLSMGGDSPADQGTADVVGQSISTPATSTANAGGTNQLTPQPPGPPPPGKVWSPEHGHWHDAGGAGVAGATSAAGRTSATAPGQQLTPQPPGPPPPGKVWSPEHGHWHDAP